MTFHIAGIGTAVPRPIAQAEAAEISKSVCCTTREQERLLAALFRRSGVQTRRSVLLEASDGPLELRQSFFPPLQSGDDHGPATSSRMEQYERHAAPLAVASARRALADANLQPAAVTHLVTVSCSGFSAPGFDVALMKQLSLSPGVARTHVGFMGCHGTLNAIRVAAAFTEANPDACVLITAVELCSLHYHYGWDPERIVANALFSDGAASLVGVGRTESPEQAGWSVRAGGSHLIAGSEDAMTWRIGDHGFCMTLSPAVPDLIQTHLRPWMEQWLAEHGLAVSEVPTWAIHPGGPRILTACADALQLPAAAVAQSQAVLAAFGNMSSATLVFILERLRQQNAARPCLALGFGPGLAIEATLLVD